MLFQYILNRLLRGIGHHCGLFVFRKLAQSHAYGRNPDFLPYQIKLLTTSLDNYLNSVGWEVHRHSNFGILSVAQTGSRMSEACRYSKVAEELIGIIKKFSKSDRCIDWND